MACPVQERATVSAHKNISILVVDDEPIVRQLIKNLLHKLGFDNVDEAADGQSAMDKMGPKNYGLVFSDWKMGPMNGIDLVKKMRAAGNTVPIIMVTSNNTAVHEAEARKSGVNDFIKKDVDLRTLRDKINDILDK